MLLTFPRSLVWSYTTSKDFPSSIFLPSLPVNSSERSKHKNVSKWTSDCRKRTHTFHHHVGSSVPNISYTFLCLSVFFFFPVWCPVSSCCRLRLRPAAFGSSGTGGVAGVHHLLHGSAPLPLFPGRFLCPTTWLTWAPLLGPLSLFLSPAARPLRRLHGGIAAWRREKGRRENKQHKRLITWL